jgi:hypothetical protein
MIGRRVAMFATPAFTFSGGIAVHSRILRSELVAACPVIFALMIQIAVGRRASIARPLAMTAAAGRRRPVRVKSAVLTLGLRLPVYPNQRTSPGQPDWSGSCQQQTRESRRVMAILCTQ